MKIHYTRTGKIFVDATKSLEWLTVGDYGKENNLKANFLGLTKQINGVQHNEVDLKDKWVVTVSTQKGCQCKCMFCDVPKVKYCGNVNIDEFSYMLRETFNNENCNHTKRLNLHYARMGEPTFNRDVIEFTYDYLDNIVNSYIKADTIHPVISTMLPKYNKGLLPFLHDWCDIKKLRNGEAGLQFSIQSTDDKQREQQFNGLSCDLNYISTISKLLPKPIGRKYTLNFAVTKDTILDAKKLNDLFDKEYWIVKITPIHQTNSALTNNFDITTSYDNYDVYEQFEQPLIDLGWDVIVFVPSKEEDEDRITCGNALLSDKGLL